MTNEKNMFVSVRQVGDIGETSDIIALEVEARSNLGQLIQSQLAERMEMDVGREWSHQLLCGFMPNPNDYIDTLKMIDQFVSTKPNWNLTIVIGRTDNSLQMPNGEICLKVSSAYLWGLENRL